jgi:putative transposase
MLRKDPFINGEYYHIYNRGVDKRLIFTSKSDYKRFIILLFLANSNAAINLNHLLTREKKSFEDIFKIEKIENLVSVGAWCLMPNHFHILIKQEADGGITKFMKKLSTGYSMYFNKKYNRQGALWGGPFKSKLIGVDDNYMRQLLAYIHLNPLDLKFPEWENDKSYLNQEEVQSFLNSYEFSSYKDYLNIERLEKIILTRDTFPQYFTEDDSFQVFVENYFKQL